jgi:hypothetical protein
MQRMPEKESASCEGIDVRIAGDNLSRRKFAIVLLWECNYQYCYSDWDFRRASICKRQRNAYTVPGINHVFVLLSCNLSSRNVHASTRCFKSIKSMPRLTFLWTSGSPCASSGYDSGPDILHLIRDLLLAYERDNSRREPGSPNTSR